MAVTAHTVGSHRPKQPGTFVPLTQAVSAYFAVFVTTGGTTIHGQPTTKMTDPIIGKRGRPLGSKETPHTLLKNELKATATTLYKARMFIERQIAECEKLLNHKDVPLQSRLDAIDTITTVTEKLGRVMDTAAKNLAPNKSGASDQPDNDTQSAEQIIKGLLQ